MQTLPPRREAALLPLEVGLLLFLNYLAINCQSIEDVIHLLRRDATGMVKLLIESTTWCLHSQ
jgi:hypothetical protein